MIGLTPMPLVDDFLIPYHVGHAIFLLFLFALAAGVVKKSGKITAIQCVTFGVLFMLAPGINPSVGLTFAMFGLALIVIGPLIYATTAR